MVRDRPQHRAVVGFLKVVRPLNDVHRVPKARVGSGGEHERGYVPLSLGGLGDLPHDANFVIKDD